MNSIIATIITFAIALAFLRLMDFFAQRGWIEPRVWKATWWSTLFRWQRTTALVHESLTKAA